MKTQNNFRLISMIITVGDKEVAIQMGQVLYIKYTEDIQSATKRMEIQITDSQTGICSALRGMERVYIEIADSKDNLIGGYYTVYDIQDRVTSGILSKATLMLCTPDFINNAAIKLSKKFGTKGAHKTIDKIVTEDILEGVLQTAVTVDPVNIETTFNKYSFVSPYWCPFTIISWLASKSIPVKGSGASASAGFAFYENARGYNFKSYDSYSAERTTKTFIVGSEPKENKDIDEDNVILTKSMRVVSTTDVLKGLNIGSYASRVMTLDLADMKYEEFEFNINKYYDKVDLLNKASKPKYFEGFTGKTAATRIMSKIVDTALFSTGTHTKGLTKQLSQSSLREKLFYNKIVEIDYIGMFDVTVGDVVQLDVYKGKEREYDEQNSGKYVIGKVERTFQSGNDMMGTQLKLITDSPGA